MPKHIEKETRVMLTKQQYEDIVNFYKSKNANYKVIDQLNIYFDDKTNNFYSRNYVLRIRQMKSQIENYEFTIKYHSDEGSVEINQDLSKTEFDNLKDNQIMPNGEIKENLLSLGFDIFSIHQIGYIFTNRTRFIFDNFLLEIDANKYGDKIDYNLEIESDDLNLSTTKILEICKEFNLKYSKNYIVKSTRAIEYLKNN